MSLVDLDYFYIYLSMYNVFTYDKEIVYFAEQCFAAIAYMC